jgi:hypothetical protein
MHLVTYHLQLLYCAPQGLVKPLQAFSLYPSLRVILHGATN